MSNLTLPVAGAAIGSYFGPWGAQIGWLVGSYIQGQNADPIIQQVGDLRVQTSQYGGAIPYVVGTQRVNGNVIWYGGKKKYTRDVPTAGKGGGPDQKIEGWTCSFAVAICKGPILGVSKMWDKGSLIIDGIANPGAKLAGQLYVGDDSQMPDPTMEAVLGVGNVPAYKGLAYMVMTDFDLGQSGVLPMFSFLVHKPEGVI